MREDPSCKGGLPPGERHWFRRKGHLVQSGLQGRRGRGRLKQRDRSGPCNRHSLSRQEKACAFGCQPAGRHLAPTQRGAHLHALWLLGLMPYVSPLPDVLPCLFALGRELLAARPAPSLGRLPPSFRSWPFWPQSSAQMPLPTRPLRCLRPTLPPQKGLIAACPLRPRAA